jgi:glutathione S-transferase
VINHAAIGRFALRGAGQPGPRPVSAPLADPTGVAATQHEAGMDAALRHVAHALLVGVQEKQVMEHALQVGWVSERAASCILCAC